MFGRFPPIGGPGCSFIRHKALGAARAMALAAAGIHFHPITRHPQ